MNQDDKESVSTLYYRDWTHWDQDTYRAVSRAWSSLNRAFVDETDDNEDGREFRRLRENMDAYDDWWNQHDYPPERTEVVKRVRLPRQDRFKRAKEPPLA